MTDQADKAIPAATILLLRDDPLEVLMIERHADTPFAGGAIVFPGGRIEPSDAAGDWRDFCDGANDVPTDQFGPRIASIREAFEEAGVLLARKDGRLISNEEAGALNHHRKAVEGNDALFRQMIAENGLRLALDELHLFARWEPPLNAIGHARRYHTWFFAAKTPEGQEAREDGNEATEAFWATPAGALADCEAGKRKAIFPTKRNLELLGLSGDAKAVLDFAATRKIDVIIPGGREENGEQFVTIPEGLGYPVTEENLKTAFRT